MTNKYNIMMGLRIGRLKIGDKKLKFKKEKVEVKEIEYCVQVVKSSFTKDMFCELVKAEFNNKQNSGIEELIVINSEAFGRMIGKDILPFSMKLDDTCKAIYIAYANKNGIVKIDCLIVNDIDSDFEAELAENKGIIRVVKD